ncbi:MAG: bifunctional demethylmenaquinone methyltransferase/2-methoxy-6-polyprenyl-1,4-benzoquinol methylase UbiE [Phycisphaerales bacterium]|nr:bifunctional demethylmenaquinone methyltransferase/2-methoxy-6-polyprenyl-1,4-benzoquinol methylase UbiE [Phycisphaerales bacterium]
MTAGKPLIWDETRLADPHAQPDKANRVQHMFDGIAPTYERVNRVLSAGRDAYWRRRAVELAQIKPSDEVLDVACGTGDFARAFASARPARVVGSDFSAGMLSFAAYRPAPVEWCRADALGLPFQDASFDVVSCAFGVRNFQDLDAGLREMRRVLRPAGRACILEFTMPRTRILGNLYLFYFRNVLPRVASIISRDKSGAYDYLPQSVSTFLDAPSMARSMERAGFSRVTFTQLTLGVATVYIGHAP